MKDLFISSCPVCAHTGKDQSIVRVIDEKHSFYKCLFCGTVYISPLDFADVVYDEKYNSEFYRPSDVRKAGLMAHKIASYIPENIQKPSVLEIGIGNGLTSFLLQALGYIVFGTEVCSSYAEELRKKYNIAVLPLRIEDLKMVEKFDVVYSSHVIEHCPDPHIYFRNAWTALRKGGLLIIDTPNASLVRNLSSEFKHFSTRDKFEHCCILSEKSSLYLCKKHGFKPVAIVNQPFYQSFFLVARKLNND